MKETIQAEKKLLLFQLLPLPSKANPRGRAERLGNFAKPTGELGRVEQPNEDDVLVEWDKLRSYEIAYGTVVPLDSPY